MTEKDIINIINGLIYREDSETEKTYYDEEKGVIHMTPEDFKKFKKGIGDDWMTEKKLFTRAEVTEIIHDVRIHYYRMYGDEMSLSDRLFFKDIAETIENQVDYSMELLEKDGDDWMNEKRISDIWCSETGDIGFTYDGVDLTFKGNSLETFLNELLDENEQLKKENKFLRCTIESNSQDDYIDYLEKQNEILKERITELASNDKIVFMNGQDYEVF